MNPISRILDQVPLTIKMVFLTILIGGGVGYFANIVATTSVKELFEKHFRNLLEQSSLENRIRFDNYLNNFRSLATLIATQESFLHHLDDIKQIPSPEGPVRYQYYPDWFPSRSLMRSLATPRFVMIYSKNHILLEVYHAKSEKNVPEKLFKLDRLSIEKSNDVTHITSLNSQPFIISSKSAQNIYGTKATLVIASPIDELFFLQVRGDFPQQLTGLLNAEKDKILSSSDPRKLPPGMLINDINKKYLAHFHQFHEYGGAETQINFASFTPRSHLTSMTDNFMEQFNKANFLIILSIVVAIALLIYSLSLRIENITSRVKKFSSATSDKMVEQNNSGTFEQGDEITILNNSFTNLIKEVERKKHQLEIANTKLQQSLNELIDTRSDLLKAEKLAVVGQMSGIIAHELLNPITSIIIRVEKNIEYSQQALRVTTKMNEITQQHLREENFADLVKITSALEQNQRLRQDDLIFIENELSKVVQIIDSFRQMARKEKIIEEINLVDVIKEVLDEHEDRLVKKKINLSVDVQPIPLINGDFMEFHSIIVNLVTNAVHAIETRNDSIDRLISITMKPHEYHPIEIIVSDTGTGIAPENLEEVFTPSFTTKGRNGTGLGLAISRKIARGYNGDLVILHSQLNKGTTFQVLLNNYPGKNRRGNHAG